MKLYEIGQKIKVLREEKKLTQEELANICGISRVTLGKVEKGELGNTSVKTLGYFIMMTSQKYGFHQPMMW